MNVNCMICNKEIEDQTFCSKECEDEARRIQKDLIEILGDSNIRKI